MSDLPALIRGEVSPPLGLIHDCVNEKARLMTAYRAAFGADAAIRESSIRGLPGFEIDRRRFGTAHINDVEQQVDAAIWNHAIEHCGFSALMNTDDVWKLRDQIRESCPPVTLETMTATLMSHMENAQATFVRGLIGVFKRLSRGYKSHDGWKIGSRIVLSGLDYNGWRAFGLGQTLINDLARCLMLLDGKNPAALSPVEQHSALLEEKRRAGESEAELPYMRCRMFKNGNVHIYITSDELINKANALIAAHYGKSLGRAAA